MKRRTGCLIKRPSGYYIRVIIEGEVVVRALHKPDGKAVKTIVEARKLQAKAVVALIESHNGTSPEPTLSKTPESESSMLGIPLRGCWEAYLANPDRPDSGEHTLKAYKQYTRQFVDWVSEHHTQKTHITDIDRVIAKEYARTLSERYNGCTYNKHLMYLRLMFRTLKDSDDTPFNRIKNRPVDTVSHEALSPEQLKAVLTTTKGDLNTLLLIGAYTALRLKDACLLKWTAVDFERNTITVIPSKTRTRSAKVVCLPIHPVLRERLLALPREKQYVLPYVAWRYLGDISSLSHKLHKAFTLAGIQTKNAEGRTVISFHSLRFSMGQALIGAGFSLDVIAQVLGHSSVTMSRYYSHLADNVRSQAILSLPSFTPIPSTNPSQT
jgi:integrase